ncbi:EthD domain-containing protein [Umezawaea endophytica]|uniref:EthD domain-containing protein n=1 Tax=Umezawaea endophytica TaxID=1654476 RepID=A0A9X2VXH2_9PSEU|nr:EthD domain-containing protein [Umezawaea endophytica]MCS7484623.1 EthD domain-containing protein [Umezawaea endophytica]
MIKMILALKRAKHMTHDEFVDYQKNKHRPLLMSIPEVERHLRRFVVSYPVPTPRYPGSEFDSIVEAWFDTTADLEALFSSDNFLKLVDPDHENFIDLTSVQQMVCEEDVVIDRG